MSEAGELLIDGLIRSLPRNTDEPWPIEKRAKWLRAAARNFDLIYPDTGDESIKVTAQRVNDDQEGGGK